MIPKNIILNKYKCAICNLVRKNGVKEKSRISYLPVAVLILKIAKAKQDDVFVRFSDIQTPERLLAADIYCHKDCKRAYLRDYIENNAQCVFCNEKLKNIHKKIIDVETAKLVLEVASSNGDEEMFAKILQHYNLETQTMELSMYSHAVCRNSYLYLDIPEAVTMLRGSVAPLVEDMLSRGYFLTLSDIRDHVKEHFPQTVIHNYQIRSYLSAEFKDDLKFAQPHQMNKATIVYPSDISSEQLVARIQHFNRAKETGELIRRKLLEVDFGLEDKFLDSENLKDSWENTRMPETLIEFFSGLLNISKADLIRTAGIDSNADQLLKDTSSSNDVSEIDEEDECATSHDETDSESVVEPDQEVGSSSSPQKFRRKQRKKKKPKVLLAQSLFQTMFTAVNRGKKKAPLQVMTTFHIHDRSKSKTMITCFHHLAYCMSYTEYNRQKALMGAYTLMKGEKDRAPLPRHLSLHRNTIGSFDNFDHGDSSSLSGTKSNHDTVTVIYQERECNLSQADKAHVSRKPKISDCKDLKPSAHIVEKLPCQELAPFARPADFKKIPLPQDLMTGSPDPIYEEDRKTEIVTAARTTMLPQEYLRKKGMPIPDMKAMPTWAGAHALSTSSHSKLYDVGFLPILPHPITKHETVYTCLVNFNSLVNKLEQDAMAIVCDEGVYQYVMDIYMHDPKIFKNLFPMLGGFHLAKSALRCAGKYLRESGIEDGLIEPGVFGPIVLETVLGGSHYYRSFAGLSIVEDALLQLRAEAFWSTKEPGDYIREIEKLSSLQSSLIAWDTAQSNTILKQLTDDGSINRLLHSLSNFDEYCSERSEMCKYFSNYLKCMQLIKDFIRADRQSYFLLHIKATKKLLPLFTGGDGLNYQRCTSFY